MASITPEFPQASPLYASAHEFVANASAHPKVKVPQVLTDIALNSIVTGKSPPPSSSSLSLRERERERERVLTNNVRVAQVYQPKPRTSLFAAALARISELIANMREEWSQETREEGSQIAIDTTKEFYRLFSALLFIYCQPPGRGQGEFDNYDLFGDGPLWSGATIVYFLNQRERFQTLDFSYYVLSLEEAKPTPEVRAGCLARWLPGLLAAWLASCLLADLRRRVR